MVTITLIRFITQYQYPHFLVIPALTDKVFNILAVITTTILTPIILIAVVVSLLTVHYHCLFLFGIIRMKLQNILLLDYNLSIFGTGVIVKVPISKQVLFFSVNISRKNRLVNRSIGYYHLVVIHNYYQQMNLLSK